MRRSGEKNTMILNVLPTLCVAVFFFLATISAHAAADIANQASAQYADQGVTNKTISSEVVHVTVAALDNLIITKSASNLTPTVNEEVTFTIVNKNYNV